jgi:hypothetical protein
VPVKEDTIGRRHSHAFDAAPSDRYTSSASLKMPRTKSFGVINRSDQYPAAPPLSEAGPDASQDRHLSDADPLRAKIFEVLNDFPVPLTKAVVPILLVELASALNGKDL